MALTLVKNGSNLEWTGDSLAAPEPAFLLGLDWEVSLKYITFADMDRLNAMGVNVLTATLYGGDAKDVHFYVDRKRPESGVRREVIDDWKAKADYWRLLNPRNIMAVMVFEIEDQNFWRDRTELFRVHCGYCREIASGQNDIAYAEEWQIGPGNHYSPSQASERVYIIREVGFRFVGSHNPNAAHEADTFQYLIGVVDFAFVQCTLGDLPMIVKRNTDRGFVVIASEASVPYGFKPGDTAAFQQWCSAEGLAGALAFVGALDQKPVNVFEFADLFRAGLWKSAPWSDVPVFADGTLVLPDKSSGAIETRTAIGVRRISTEFGMIGRVAVRFRVDCAAGEQVDIRLGIADASFESNYKTRPFGPGEHVVKCVAEMPENVFVRFDALNFIGGSGAAKSVRLLGFA